jgi:hypothetical protein
MAKFKVHELRTRSKTELLNQVSDSFELFPQQFFGVYLHIFGVVVDGCVPRVCVLSYPNEGTFLKTRFFCPSLQGDGAWQVKSAAYH